MEKIFVGMDLGTTNSAVAVFDGEKVNVIRNKRGDVNTPSIVRTSKSGVTVGERARKFLDTDAVNTHREFKRLMGTGRRTKAGDDAKEWLPEELSAEVLKSLIDDVTASTGVKPDHAVVTVPALFELPQSRATSEAARLAGLLKVELLPEPVASAFAAGWTVEAAGESWLVFDLGGGTFDVSLVEARDGLLRVIGHDGDNFLGGRDIDRQIVEWVIREIEARHEISVPVDESQRSLVASLYSEAEQAKIRLSEQDKTTVEIDIDINGRELTDALSLTRGELEVLSSPIIDRALQICRRLLDAHGLAEDGLSCVVLVGGPANMPVVRERIVKELAPLAAEKRDPMTLVAEGACLYALSIGLSSELAEEDGQKGENKFWLQYPNVCSEFDPTVMGRLVESGTQKPVSLQFYREGWEGERILLNEEGAFLSSLSIKASGVTRFNIRYFDEADQRVSAHPDAVSIVHGMTLSDPPLSRSIGVSLANGQVKRFIERGTALPARRTFVQTTISSLMPGEEGEINIPIVQGERTKACFCRKVGGLVVRSADLKKPLLAGSRIEITLEIDRGGNMEAQALILDQNVLVKSVAELLIPNADVGVMRNMWQSTKRRIGVLQQEAFREKDEGMVRSLDGAMQLTSEIGVQLAGPMDDEDTRQRLYRNLLEIDADIEELEQRGQLRELRDRCEEEYLNTTHVVMAWGGDTDKKLLVDMDKRLKALLENGRVTELERAIEQLERLNVSAYRKSPEYWSDQFQYAASRVHLAKDIKRASKLVDKGRALLENGRMNELQHVTLAIWSLLPDEIRAGEETHGSGIL